MYLSTVNLHASINSKLISSGMSATVNFILHKFVHCNDHSSLIG